MGQQTSGACAFPNHFLNGSLRLSMSCNAYSAAILLTARILQFAHQLLNLALIVCSALMIWKGLCVVTGSESPVVVVLRFESPCTEPFLSWRLRAVAAWSPRFT